MITVNNVDYLIDELAKPIMVLRFARAMMHTARGNQWIGAKKRADGARQEIVDILNKHEFVQDID